MFYYDYEIKIIKICYLNYINLVIYVSDKYILKLFLSDDVSVLCWYKEY